MVGHNVFSRVIALPTVYQLVEIKHLLCRISSKGYDYARVEVEVNDHGYIPHIRRIGEAKMADGEKTQPARRWVVERTIAWMKGFRAIRTRYFCKAQNYLAMIHLACALIVFRKLETV